MDNFEVGRVRVLAEVLPFVNFALQNNGRGFIGKVSVVGGETDAEDVVVSVSSSPEFFERAERRLDFVPAGKTVELRELPVILNGEYLASLTERVNAAVRISVSVGGTVTDEINAETAVLAFDQWHGYGYFPELLCSFVTPNHPEIGKIVSESAALLGRWTGDPSFDGYQSKDPNRVLKQAAALFGTLKGLNIVYTVAPAGFEAAGQRVRLCDTVLSRKTGNCLDMTLLYAACLEAAGLHPLLIITEGHIFTGLWLEDMSFPEAVSDDTSVITKRLAGGINEIAAVETTALSAGKDVSFDEAMAAAERELLGVGAARCIIDVGRSRLSGVRPLPLRVRAEDGGLKAPRSDIPVGNAAENMPKSVEEAVSAEIAEREGALPKKVQWERKLLDFGLRNSLVNMRLSRTTVPILTTSLGSLEDALADGGEFNILPKPENWKPAGGETSFENIHDLGEAGQLIESEFGNKRLRSVFTETELNKLITGLYRTSKSASEENGANTLYLALGLLRWFETERSPKARYAPIVLLPVEIIRKSAVKGFVIRLRDDEPQMNITLLEKLRQDFGADISGLDPLPADEHGIDMKLVFTTVRKAVMAQPRWDVLESAYLGIFSFSQFVMWNDIRSRSDALAKNKIVRSLMEGRLSWDAEPMEMGERVRESGVLTPMAADASQLFAIRSACEGKSFVLHGPPGTGKSQTITTLIANALAEGKSVLFAAEKMAALEVVQKRLDRLGIGAFCLELHSNKARKRDFLEQLKEASETAKALSPAQYKQRAEQIERLRKELDGYCEELHRGLKCGSSVYSLINEYEGYREAVAAEGFGSEFVSGLDGEQIHELDSLIERLAAAGRAVGHPCGHTLSEVRTDKYSQQLKSELPSALSRYKAALEAVEAPLNELNGAAGGEAVSDFGKAVRLEEIGRELLCLYGLPKAWRCAENGARLFSELSEMSEHFISAAEKEAGLLQSFNPLFLQQDGNALLNEFNRINAKWALGRSMGLSGMAKRLSGFSKATLDKNGLQGHLTLLCEYQTEKRAAEELFDRLGDGLGGLYAGKDTDWRNVKALADKARSCGDRLCELGGGDGLRIYCGGREELKGAAEKLCGGFSELKAAKDGLYGLLDIDGDAKSEGEDWTAAQLELCGGIEDNLDSLKEWCAFNGAVKAAEAAGLSNIVGAYKRGLNHEELFKAYKRSLLLSLINWAVDGSKALSEFSGAVFNEKINQLKRIDEEMEELSRKEIFYRLASRLPDFARESASNPELTALQRVVKSGGRGVSIRQMFKQLPTVIPRLCPCMLMSPISAAQYLDPDREPFDIVVFDEASQLPTCKAVGVLARGRDAVIVGDPKQMPPTSFFSANTFDEDNTETEDLESILDDCLALNMPQTHLLWHYRSRHESLIAFSNREFYDNRLFTFPSVNDRESKVSLVHTEGIFDRGKTRQNRIEAEAAVEELKRRCHDPELSRLSVGVVTFNISQQTLIEDLLNDACKQDEELEKWAFGSEEPVFVKNLENVQGDERDVILFSVGFGPDKEGNVYMNFGPLNRDGGWRRLNVAVSRARCEMKVFSSLTADMINLSKTGAEGVRALKAFLEYAGGKELPLCEGAGLRRRSRERVAASICGELKKRGYDTELSVGHSEYRVDIGVVDPADRGRYLLGILLDGECYGSAKTVRDRELAQINVLNGLGWRIARVWSMDWWDNREKEVERVLEQLSAVNCSAPVV